MNLDGRDFVVGDIHGAYDLVLKGLKEIKFDARQDRLFSVGDLVDRGRQSARAQAFLDYKGLHGAVRGNHEQTFLDLYAETPDPDQRVLEMVARLFHMEWWLDVSKDDRSNILKKFAALPVAIEIQTRRGTVGIVHGEVPIGMDWDTFLKRLEKGDVDVYQAALQGRGRIQSNNQSGVVGIDRLFVGHTVRADGPKQYGNVFAIDTGAIFSEQDANPKCGLTIANLLFKTSLIAGITVDPGQIAGSHLFVLSADDHSEKGGGGEIEAFSNYTG